MSFEQRVAELELEHRELSEELASMEVSDIVSMERFEELMNELYGDVDVCGFSKPSGTLLREVDPIAFNESYLNYCNALSAGEFDEYQDLSEQINDIQSEIDDLKAITTDLETI